MLLVYALALGGKPGGAGVMGESLRLVRCGDLDAIASDVDRVPEPTLEHLSAWDQVVRQAHGGAEALLPSRFASAFASEDELRATVEARGPSLHDALELVRGRDMMTLRLAGTPPPRPVADTEGMGPGERYLRERALEHGAPELEPLRPCLAALVRAERCERHPYQGHGAALIASVFHLVDRGAADAYRAAAEANAAAIAPLHLTVTGPHPAYAFAPEAP